MKRRMLSFLVSLMLLSITGYVFAANSLSLDGRPDGFMPGKTPGYFIWQDKNGLHIRTTSSGNKHVFSGAIYTDGVFENTFGKTESADDHFVVNGDRNKINFQFTNIEGVTGMDVHLKNGTYVTVNLSVDGNEMNPSQIFLGENGWHPMRSKITLRHEGDGKYDNGDCTVIFVSEPSWWYQDRGIPNWTCTQDLGPGPTSGQGSSMYSKI
ncbi:MAG: hypothetical protein H6Q67_978 [Firmicutes bacterium]|nr:hypothetical protein [Bacillota bacterium]